MAARSRKMRVPPLAFFIAKYFGSGVIIATAFIHVSNSQLIGGWTGLHSSGSLTIPVADTFQLLAPANEALTSPCISGPITDYSWAEGIALMTVFTMFFIEIMAARYDVFGTQAHDLEASDPSKEVMRASGKAILNTPLKNGQ